MQLETGLEPVATAVLVLRYHHYRMQRAQLFIRVGRVMNGDLDNLALKVTLLGPQPRLGDKLLGVLLDCPQHGPAVLKGLNLAVWTTKPLLGDTDHTKYRTLFQRHARRGVYLIVPRILGLRSYTAVRLPPEQKNGPGRK